MKNYGKDGMLRTNNPLIGHVKSIIMFDCSSGSIIKEETELCLQNNSL